MPTTAQSRLDATRARPRIIELWWALRPLVSVVRFMQSGAHPDDESSSMLAALAFRDGINLSYACSTRGEGGQNDIGTEAGADLGALRTREMERACDVLGMRMYWHSETVDDPITDFGFSKSGDDTLARWGHERTLARFVEIVRLERPDILCPTFLDVPGQHGHHRAMTRAAHEVIEAAADPAFPSNLAPWQVSKLYLPAWSGAGQAYDDDAPPPAATLTIDGAGFDPVSGWTWMRIGEMSRAFHRTQGMGRWPAPDAARDWPLHLARSHVEGPDTALWSGLPRNLGELSRLDGAEPIAADLGEAQTAIDDAMAAFPDFARVAEAATLGLSALRRARSDCPEAVAGEVVHRLDAKEVQLGHVIRLALGVEARAMVSEVYLHPGQACSLAVETAPGDADSFGTEFDLPHGWDADGDRLAIGANAAPTDPYRTAYDPAAPPAPAMLVSIGSNDQHVTCRVPFERDPFVLPPVSAAVTPDAAIVNLARPLEDVRVSLTELRPVGGTARLALPEGWAARETPDGMAVTPPRGLTPGLRTMAVEVDGKAATTQRRIEQPHVAATAQMRPAALRVCVIDAEVPDVKVGYVGTGNDGVAYWLAAMGANVSTLAEADLESDTALAEFDTIVVGVFAMRFRAGLAEAVPRLHRWCEAGGTLVTLYHRPWDNWDPDSTPPRRLEIGQPSLRWRVTDETASVRHLRHHALLSNPNRIGPGDWEGWVKERGLYFAKSWDDAYLPLLEMADPGEAAHQGALLTADIGRGRHTHTSLILHHQMANLVPGAFRLMANLIARRE